MAQDIKLQKFVMGGLLLGIATFAAGQLIEPRLLFYLTLAAVLTLVALTLKNLAQAMGSDSAPKTNGDAVPVLRGLRTKKAARQAIGGLWGRATVMVCVAAAVHVLILTLIFATHSQTVPGAACAVVLVVNAVAALVYANAVRSTQRPITWLCPNPQCRSRHISERHAWRCAFCTGINQNVSMLDTCQSGDCREPPTGYLCAACGTTMLFDGNVDPDHVAVAAAWTPPAPETERQKRRRELQQDLIEVTEDEELRDLEILRDRRRQRLHEAANPVDARQRLRSRAEKRKDVLDAFTQEKQTIEDTYADKHSRLRAIADLEDDLDHELDQLRRRTEDV